MRVLPPGTLPDSRERDRDAYLYIPVLHPRATPTCTPQQELVQLGAELYRLRHAKALHAETKTAMPRVDKDRLAHLEWMSEVVLRADNNAAFVSAVLEPPVAAAGLSPPAIV